MSDRDNRGGASRAEIHQIIAQQIGADAKYLPGPDVMTSGEWIRKYRDEPLRERFETRHREMQPLREAVERALWAAFWERLRCESVRDQGLYLTGMADGVARTVQVGVVAAAGDVTAIAARMPEGAQVPRKVFVLSRATSTEKCGSSAATAGIYADYWSAARAGSELGAATPWSREDDGVWNSVVQADERSIPRCLVWFVIEEHEVKP